MKRKTKKKPLVTIVGEDLIKRKVRASTVGEAISTVVKIKCYDGEELVWVVEDIKRGKKVVAALHRILGKPHPLDAFIDAGPFG